MHSIELLLDASTDAAVRDQWQVLRAADLPTQADHQGATNAPHVTLAARPLFDDSADERLGEVLAALPLPVDLGALVVFGAPPRGLVLARLVVVTTALLDLHAHVHDALGAAVGDARHTTPGHWTPHVTLAHRMTPEQLSRALQALDDADGAALEGATLSSGRRWDGTAKVVTPL
ncbi:2'-5' RNA ligase family protein [Frigoribacterium salinisoli]